MSYNFQNKSEEYLFSRKHFRKLAKIKFLAFNEHAGQLITSSHELVANLTLFVSGKNFRDIENGLYVADLMISFCRSHFIAIDLIFAGELVEAALIIRKQMELIARLNQLSEGLDIETIIRKTPNMKHFKGSIKRLYSEYSEISHSASPKVMQLLGRIDMGEGMYTPLYPEFHENGYAAMQHLILVVVEYYRWCATFLAKNFTDYDAAHHSSLLKTILDNHQKVFTNAEVKRSERK
ncbi:hypothetical protein ACK32Q_10075 [Aeromonas dhakensis]|uniref:hypothetical protein n=1 Tax=Aeromonas dhakensis TaxID=196024 RepID=UPI003986B773